MTIAHRVSGPVRDADARSVGEAELSSEGIHGYRAAVQHSALAGVWIRRGPWVPDGEIGHRGVDVLGPQDELARLRFSIVEMVGLVAPGEGREAYGHEDGGRGEANPLGQSASVR